MNSQRHLILRIVTLSILVSILGGCAAGHLSSEQRSQVDSLFVASYDLPNHAKRVFISPQGVLEIETTESEGAYDKGEGQRTLIDLRSGSRIWSGALQDGYMITDAPSPVIVETHGRDHKAVRYDRQGQVLWEIAGEGLFVFGLGVEEDGMLLLLSLRQTGPDVVHAIMGGIRLNDGQVSWQADLGAVSWSDDEIGSLWRYDNRPIFAHRGNAFLLLENRALCLSVTNGEIISDWRIPRQGEDTTQGRTIWIPLDQDVIVVSGAHVVSISGDANRNWYANLGETRTATEAMLCNQDLFVAFSGSKERGAGALDVTSGGWRWQASDEAKPGAPPNGLAVVGDTVVVASSGRLHGFHTRTGERLYAEDVPKDAQKLITRDADVILIGSESIECRSAPDGGARWSMDKLGSPLALFYKSRKASMAIVSASMAGTASISANQSRYYYGLANRRIGGSYAYDPWTRMQYTQLSRSAANSAAMSRIGASMVEKAGKSSGFIDRKVSIIVDMQNEEPLTEWAYFLVPMKSGALNYQTNTAKLLAIRLSDGSTREIPVMEAPTTCIPTAMVSQELGLIIQAYHKFPFCNWGKKIDVLRLPGDFTAGNDR